jgi:hypothetical protein
MYNPWGISFAGCSAATQVSPHRGGRGPCGERQQETWPPPSIQIDRALRDIGISWAETWVEVDRPFWRP